MFLHSVSVYPSPVPLLVVIVSVIATGVLVVLIIRWWRTRICVHTDGISRNINIRPGGSFLLFEGNAIMIRKFFGGYRLHLKNGLEFIDGTVQQENIFFDDEITILNKNTHGENIFFISLSMKEKEEI